MLLAVAPGSLGNPEGETPPAEQVSEVTAPAQTPPEGETPPVDEGTTPPADDETAPPEDETAPPDDEETTPPDDETGVETPGGEMPPGEDPPDEVGTPGEPPDVEVPDKDPAGELPDDEDTPGRDVAGKPEGGGASRPGAPAANPTSESATPVGPETSTPLAGLLPPPTADFEEPGASDSTGERSARFGGAPRDGGGFGSGGGTPALTPGTGGTAVAGVLDGGGTVAAAAPAGGDGAGAQSDGGGSRDESSDGGSGGGDRNPAVEVVRDIVEVVPESLKIALAGLAALSVLLGAGYLFTMLRARRLSRQRRELLKEVGLLQSALLPPVPDQVGALRTSVAYRPADGPGAGGDFYDVVPLAGGRVGFVLGDVSGHGRGALARTAFMRYTLRAYLEAGLEPRVALQVAGRVIDDNLGGDFATVLVAVHDPETGSLTYATAGHPAPIVVGPHEHEPVTAASSPPIGVGVRTGLRQTTLPLVPGSVACLFTDGLMEARTHDGMLGRERLQELLAELGPDATAEELIAKVRAEADTLSDDIAACIVTPTAPVTANHFRTEQLELTEDDLDGTIVRRFLESCGVPGVEIALVERDARPLAQRFGGVVLHVVFGNRLRVELLPRNVESIEVASRRAAAATA